MTASTTPYPLHALRAVALHAQRLTTPNGAEPSPTPDAIYDTVDALGCVQIDTLHMVARSHYLALWSRLGAYQPADFDGLIFKDGERRLFEYWGHAASVIPLADYRHYLPAMQRQVNAPSTWWERWTTDNTNRATLEEVRRRLAEEGALRAADFEYNGRKRESWWDWKPAKHALEYLFAAGEVMIANRVNFQRVYDLTERVLPGWVDTTEPTQDEARRHFVEQAGRRLGVFEPMQAVDYAYLKRGTGRKHAEALVEDGTFVEIGGEQHDGWRRGTPTATRCRCWIRPRRARSGPSAPRSSARSTACCGPLAATCRCGASSRCSNATSARPTASGATSACRSCTGTGWWAASTPSSTARRRC